MKYLITIALAGLLCGCASVGTNFNSARVTEIQKGKTTEPELISMFGKPMSRGVNSESGTSLMWIYTQAQAKGATFIPLVGPFVGGTTSKTKSLSVMLSPDGTVASYNYSGGAMETSGMPQSDPNDPPVKPLASPKAGN